MSAENPIRLLIAEDEPSFRSVLSRELARRGHEVTVAEDGNRAAACLDSQEFDVVLLDVRMPGRDGLDVLALVRQMQPPPEAVMLTGNSTVEVAVEAMKLGACDFVTKPCKLDVLDQILRKAAEKRSLHRENAALRRRLGAGNAPELVFAGPTMRRVDEMIRRLAPSDGTVLIVGENGTGKKLAAHAIHAASDRAGAPFVEIHCGGLPETQLESELFGHETGAFAGADRARPGLFEMAHGGTLFLDEIGELPQSLQVRLLHVLETGSLYRVGGRRRIGTDVRVVTATNRDLAHEIESGRFREDLHFRINELKLQLPALRERREDIPPLAAHFARPNAIANEAMKLLREYDWPGNVRELRNVIERATLIGGGDVIRPRDLPVELTAPRVLIVPPGITESGGSASPDAPGIGSARLRDIERQQILAVLEQVRWHRGRAAELLGVSPKTLYRKLRSYGIN